MKKIKKLLVQLNITQRIMIALAIFWTILVVGLILWSTDRTKDFTQNMIINEARAHFSKDQAFRLWATSHGGVYVPIDSLTHPNPYLSNINERDITTPSGIHLTLMNPAYIMRQINERFSEYYGVIGHITSLKPLRPQNMPDSWERKSLESFEQGNNEVMEWTEIDGKPFLRLIRPMITQVGCLKCHQQQGYKVGDIRGGVSVSLPLTSFLENKDRIIISDTLSFCFIWLIGVCFIFIGSRKLINTEKILKQSRDHLEELVNERTIGLTQANQKLSMEIAERREIEETLRKLSLAVEQNPATIVITDSNGTIQYVNPRFFELTGYAYEEVIDHNPRIMKSGYHDSNFYKKLWDTILSGNVWKGELKNKKKNGEMYWESASISPIYNYEGKITHFVAVKEDITSQVKAKEEMKKLSQEIEVRNTQLEITNEQLKGEIKERKKNQDSLLKSKIILDSIYDGVFTINEKNIITSFNTAAQNITGYSTDKAVGELYQKIFNLYELDPAIKETLNNRYEMKDKLANLVRKNGELLPIQISTSILKSGIGFGKEYAIAFRDMSQVDLLQKELKKGFTYHDMITKSPKMQRIFSILPAVSVSDSAVLIEGPTGTGKELLARAIHNLSDRKDKQYIIINCGAIPSTLIGSELFGHVKGAFTDAKVDREGKILKANGGTLFLDEIAELPIETQSKLLRLLEDFKLYKVGSDKPVKVDIRIIAATNKDLKTMIQEKKFRDDLYHRLNTVKFSLPPLEERKEDIPYLIEHFINKNNAKFNKQIVNVSSNAMRFLLK